MLTAGDEFIEAVVSKFQIEFPDESNAYKKPSGDPMNIRLCDSAGEDNTIGGAGGGDGDNGKVGEGFNGIVGVVGLITS